MTNHHVSAGRAGASLASCHNWCWVIWIWIMTLLCDINLGSKRRERRQSQIKLRGSGGPCPMTNLQTLASNHHRDNQKPISYSCCIWYNLILSGVCIALAPNPNCSSEKRSPGQRGTPHESIWSIFFHTSCDNCIAYPARDCMPVQVAKIYNGVTSRCI